MCVCVFVCVSPGGSLGNQMVDVGLETSISSITDKGLHCQLTLELNVGNGRKDWKMVEGRYGSSLILVLVSLY